MIVAEQKPVSDILQMLPADKSLLVVGCDTCVTVCLAGGEKEVRMLSSAIRLSAKPIPVVTGISIQRQCDREFLDEIGDQVMKHDIVLSMACGAGVQLMSDHFAGKIVLPALDTLFMGSNDDLGYWTERCVGCGDCVLDITGGICPKTRCSKGLMNGPCGGSENGKCEVDPDTLDCGWNLIYERLKSLNALDRMMTLQEPRDWSKSHDGGPRSVTRKDVRL